MNKAVMLIYLTHYGKTTYQTKIQADQILLTM